MSTNEDKREFEFIEHPVSPNKHNNSCSSSTIVKMWVLLEGSPKARKLHADLSEVKDLDDFIHTLKQNEDFKEELKNAKLQNIVLINNDNAPISPDTELQTLANNTVKTPLVVRYPISSVNLKLTFMYGHKQGKRDISHTSGSFDQLRALAREIFKDLEEGTTYFENDGTEIWNTYNFNTVVSSQTVQDNNNVMLKLKVLIKGRKKYSDWRLKEVFKDILGKPFISTITQMDRFDMTELPKLDPPFSQDELKIFVTLKSFGEEFDNETKNRVYINAFMKTAVCYLLNRKKRVLLDVEIHLSGSKGYGPVDYWVTTRNWVTFIEVLLLLCEAKADDMNQAVAQVVVQMHSAIEQLEQLDQEPTIFGIAATGKTWRFIRWVGSSEKPTVHVSKEYNCNYSGNMEKEKEVLEYITQILQTQVESVECSHLSKRQRTGQ